MNRFLSFDTGALSLRVALGIVLLAHSFYLKAFVFTLPGTAAYFSSIGLPGVLAYVVFIAEILAGIAIIAGVYTRVFSAIVIPILLGATWAHFPNGWLFTNTGGGWEFPLFLTVMAFVQLNIGAGKYVLFLPSATMPLTVK
ncbi:MAG: DoxX family protein [Cellvibrionaceae bacterium]